MTVLNNTHNIGTEYSVYKKGSTINVNFEFLRNKKYLIVKAKDSTGKEKILNVGDDYSLDISDGLNGAYGVVTLLKDLDDPLSKISLSRSIPTTQEKNLSSRVIFSSDLEMSLDRLTIMIQDLTKLINKMASKTNLGIVQIGENIDVNEGLISVPLATHDIFGVVKPGENLNINEGVISVATATNTAKGVVKVGENLIVDEDGMLDLRLPKDLCADAIKPAILPSVGYWNSVCYGAGMFVAVGGSGNIALISFDGINWLSKNLPHSDGWTSVCYGGGKFVAVQSGTSRGAYSTDGVVWIEFPLPFYAHWSSVCYGGNKFVVVSRREDYTEQTGVYSYDGVKWLPMDINVPYLSSACYGTGMFVAVGGQKISYSRNGINWSSIDMPGTNWISVCYGNGKFVAVQSGTSRGAYSYDGINWERMDVAIPDLTSVCYGGNKFVAVSSDGVWTYSADGIIWTGMPVPISNRWNSVCYGGSRFVVVSGDTQAIVIPFVNGSLSTVSISGKYSDLTEKLTAGANVQINGMTVSATDTRYNNATQSSDGLMSSDDKRKVDNLSTVATSGSYNDLSNKPLNASTSADGLMSKEDKIKLNAAMKFPDGEIGYTLPNAAGRKDRLITFDSNGNLDLHGTHDYDKWRNIRIPTDESTSGLNLELPTASARANKVIGFGSDGKNVEMKDAGGTEQVNSDWNATSGKAQIFNKPALAPVATSGNYNDLYNKIGTASYGFGGFGIMSLEDNPDNAITYPGIDGIIFAPKLKPATASTLGGIKVGSGLSINSNGVLSTTGDSESGEFINEPVITGDMVSERIAFVDRGKHDLMPSCVASFVINGKKTFFMADFIVENNYIYRSNDCVSWYKIGNINNAYRIVSFLQSGENILFATSLDDSPYEGEIFLSSDGGYNFIKIPYWFQSFHGWCESQGNILICSYHGLHNSTDYGNTWSVVPNSIRDIFSSPVFFKGKFYFFRKTRELDEYSEIVSMTVSDKTFITEHTFTKDHIPLSLTVDENAIYVVVKDGTGYPDSFIYSSYTGSNFTLTQVYNNMYERLLGRPNKWLLVDNYKNAWFCKNLSDNPLQVHYNTFGAATEFHYSKDTDLFVTHDTALFVSTKAYHIGTDNMSSFAAKPLGEVEGIMSVGEESDIGSITSDTE